MDIVIDDIARVWTTATEIWIERKDGARACERFEDYSRLKYATEEERNAYEMQPFGLHWKALDEDLSYEGFFDKKETTELYRFFTNHPELNASAIARRLRISQSLFAQYISGIKTPSKARLTQIKDTIRALGKELASV